MRSSSSAASLASQVATGLEPTITTERQQTKAEEQLPLLTPQSSLKHLQREFSTNLENIKKIFDERFHGYIEQAEHDCHGGGQGGVVVINTNDQVK